MDAKPDPESHGYSASPSSRDKGDPYLPLLFSITRFHKIALRTGCLSIDRLLNGSRSVLTSSVLWITLLSLQRYFTQNFMVLYLLCYCFRPIVWALFFCRLVPAVICVDSCTNLWSKFPVVLKTSFLLARSLSSCSKLLLKFPCTKLLFKFHEVAVEIFFFLHEVAVEINHTDSHA